MSPIRKAKIQTKKRHSAKKDVPWHLCPLGLTDLMTSTRIPFYWSHEAPDDVLGESDGPLTFATRYASYER